MATQAVKRGARRVLIVEDNLDTVHTFANMVRRMGHHVDYAINGYAALDTAKKAKPEFVFLDLMMPGISGFDVARRLKKEFGDAIRIIVVSAYGTDADREESAKGGCELHLIKPVDPRVIEDLLTSQAPSAIRAVSRLSACRFTAATLVPAF